MQEPVSIVPIMGSWARFGERLIDLGQALLRWWTGARELAHDTTDGVRVRYLRIERPGRPVAVLVHGFSDRPESFLPVASSLRGYDIVLPELPGFHDGSEHEAYNVSNYARWLISLLDDLGVRDAHLCGNSLGGAVVLLVAERRPDLVRSVVPLDSGGVEAPDVRSVHDEIRDGHNLFEVRDVSDVGNYIARIFHRAPPIHGPVRAWLAEDLRRKCDVYARIMSDLEVEGEAHASRGSVVDLGALDLPVLVAWGDSDSLFPLEVGRYMASQIPNARLHIFAKTGHCSHIERPRELARVCHGFWRGLP